jgi:hypothetical protein
MKAAKLTGRALDYWVGLALGYRWYVNKKELNADGFTVGSRYFLSPYSANLTNVQEEFAITEQCEANAPVGRYWDYLLYLYSSHDGQGEDLARRYNAQIDISSDESHRGNNVRARLPDSEWGPYSPTLALAVARAIVIKTYGEELQDDGFTPARVLADIKETVET